MQEVRKVEHHVRRDGRVGAHLLGDDLVHDACLGAQYLVRIRVRVLRVRVKVRGRARVRVVPRGSWPPCGRRPTGGRGRPSPCCHG